jgi:CRISPR-associated endonuclease/helicase Cas3
MPNKPTLYAHSPSAQDPKKWHAFDDHVSGVAKLAMQFAGCFGEEEAARLLGIWHDAGKLHPSWQAGLYAAHQASLAYKRQRVGVPHTDVGMAALCQLNSRSSALALLCRCHHGGLINYGELKGQVLDALKEPRVQDAIALAKQHLLPMCDPAGWSMGASWRDGLAGHLALRLRMLHSCLVDADCIDTASHDIGIPLLSSNDAPALPELRDTLAAHMKQKSTKVEVNALNAHRAIIAADAVAAARLAPGFFSLTVPTGGGKTLCGMSFALEHAVRYNKRRVIVAIPYTSIIEQNAGVYKEVFGDGAVLEHHSAASEPDGLSDEDAALHRLAALRWDAPLVVTTHVQLFESLFAARNSKLRKLHQIVDSVIILDEVQTLPPHLLAPTMQALTALTKRFGCTIVFSTATQPAFAPGLLARRDVWAEGMREIIAAPLTHFEALRRVTYHIESAPLAWDEVAARVGEESRALVICNTVKDAQALVGQLDGAPGLLHISTRLCAAHRSEVLVDVKRRLTSNVPCLLISTQVVEAGVDLDFPCVWRAMAPLDSIIQAAGRCNREGHIKGAGGRVVIFTPKEGKCPPGAYKAGRDVTINMLRDERITQDTLHLPASCTEYFQWLYGSQDPDKAGVCKMEEKLEFSDSALAYKLIDDDMTAVLIRRDAASSQERDLIDDVLGRILRFGMHGNDLRALQPYLVSLRRRDFEAAARAGLTEQVARYNGEPQPLYIWRGRYDEVLGLVLGVDQLDPDSLIIA